MKPVDRSDHLTPSLMSGYHLCQLLGKLFISVSLQCCSDVLLLDADVANPKHDISSVALDAKETAFFELMVEPKDAATCSVEVSSVLKEMEADEIAKDERPKYLPSVGEHLEDVRGRKGAVHEEAHVRIEVAPSQVSRQEQQVVIMDPDHLLVLLMLQDALCEFVVDILVD